MNNEANARSFWQLSLRDIFVAMLLLGLCLAGYRQSYGGTLVCMVLACLLLVAIRLLRMPQKQLDVQRAQAVGVQAILEDIDAWPPPSGDTPLQRLHVQLKLVPAAALGRGEASYRLLCRGEVGAYDVWTISGKTRLLRARTRRMPAHDIGYEVRPWEKPP